MTNCGHGADQSLDFLAVCRKYAFMRTTLDLPDSLFKEAKAASALRGISLKTYFTEALMRHGSSIASAGCGKASMRTQLPLIANSGKFRSSPSVEDLEQALAESENLRMV